MCLILSSYVNLHSTPNPVQQISLQHWSVHCIVFLYIFIIDVCNFCVFVISTVREAWETVEETQMCPTCRIKNLRFLLLKCLLHLRGLFLQNWVAHLSFVVHKQWDRPKARHLFLSSLYSCITLFHITSGCCGLKLPGALAKFLSL